MVDQESQNKAIQAQKDYWESLTKDLDFFKKTEPSVDVFSLEGFSIYSNWKNYFIKSSQYGYLDMARYWASRYVSEHLNWLWNDTYKRTLSELTSQEKPKKDSWKAAMKRADDVMIEKSKLMKELYS